MKLLRKQVFHLSDIPRDLDPVIAIDKKKEVDRRDVGLLQPDVERIWGLIIKLYKTGVHPAISVCIRHQDKVLLSPSIGHVRGNGPNDTPVTEKVLAIPDTPMCLLSTSKGNTALLMHMLQEDGLINDSDPVAFYAPEFARKGKDNITIHQILAHRGGTPGLPKDVDLGVLWDEERTVARTVQEFDSRTLDWTLFIPTRFSAGLMLGDEPFGIWGPNSREAFGHLGLINKFAWADPQRDLSAALLTFGLPIIGHRIPALVQVMRGNTIPIRNGDPKPFALQLE